MGDKKKFDVEVIVVLRKSIEASDLDEALDVAEMELDEGVDIAVNNEWDAQVGLARKGRAMW